jgi:hypothetical protein
MKEVSVMPPPAKVGKIGRVKIMYRPGRFGVPSIQYMSEYDFGRLQTLVNAYAKHAEVAKELNNHPNRRVRLEMQTLIGLPLSPPVNELPSKTFPFTRYALKGLRKTNLRAAPGGQIPLEPKHIDNVEFVEVVEVTN